MPINFPIVYKCVETLYQQPKSKDMVKTEPSPQRKMRPWQHGVGRKSLAGNSVSIRVRYPAPQPRQVVKLPAIRPSSSVG